MQPSVIISTTIGLILVIAGASKLLEDSSQLQGIVRGYRVLPPSLVSPVALGFPWLEFIIGFCLIVGVLEPITRVGASILFLLFAAGLTINLVRGRTDLDCGCFGAGRRGHISWWLAARNVFWAACILGAPLLQQTMWFPNGRHGSIASLPSMLVGVGLVMVYFLVAVFRQLLHLVRDLEPVSFMDSERDEVVEVASSRGELAERPSGVRV